MFLKIRFFSKKLNKNAGVPFGTVPKMEKSRPDLIPQDKGLHTSPDNSLYFQTLRVFSLPKCLQRLKMYFFSKFLECHLALFFLLILKFDFDIVRNAIPACPKQEYLCKI